MQSSYSTSQGVAFAGMLADMQQNDVMSYTSLAIVPFGVFLSQGATDGAVILPAASTDITVVGKARGLALSTQKEQNLSGVVQYEIADKINVLKKGRAWVSVEEAVAIADPVFVRFASGAGGTQLGAFRRSADSASAAQLAGAKFLTSTSGAGLAVVEFDL